MDTQMQGVLKGAKDSVVLKSLFTVNSPCPGGSKRRSSCSPTGCCIYTHRKTKWTRMNTVESTLSKATLMKLNIALRYFQTTEMRGRLLHRCISGGCVLRWWRVVGVSVQLCIHERNSCGRFSQPDEAKAAAGAVCSRQHEWKPEMRPGWNKSGLHSEKALMTGKAQAPWQDAQSYRVKSKTSHHLAAYSHIETDGQTQILESCTKFDLMLKQAFCIPVFQPNPQLQLPPKWNTGL